MAKKCKDCDPNKYIEGLAYRGANGISYDGFINYNSVGKPTQTDVTLADVNALLDAYNPIFGNDDTTALPPQSAPLSLKGIDRSQGFWLVWGLTKGLVAFGIPGQKLTAASILNGYNTTTKKGDNFNFTVTTDQVPSSLFFTDFGKIADTGSSDPLRFNSALTVQNSLIKDKMNYVGYYTGIIVSTLNGSKYITTGTGKNKKTQLEVLISKKSLTIKSKDSQGNDPIYVTSAPTIHLFKNTTFSYTLTTNLPQSQYTVYLSPADINSLQLLGLTWNSSNKTITGVGSSSLAAAAKNLSLTFTVYGPDKDSGNKQTFTLGIVYGGYNSKETLPTISNKVFNLSVGDDVGKLPLNGLNNKHTIIGIASLPEGLTFNATSKNITGTPKHAGTFYAYASCSNLRGSSSKATLTFNIGPYVLNAKAAGNTFPSVINFPKWSFDKIKNNSVTIYAKPSGDDILAYKKINISDLPNIIKNGVPTDPTDAQIAQGADPRRVRKGFMTEIFYPGRGINEESYFWLSLDDPTKNNTKSGEFNLELNGRYYLNYSSAAAIDNLDNACFNPTSTSSGPASTPYSESLKLTATNLVKGGISGNPADNVISVSFSPTNIEHQVVYLSGPGPFDTASAFAKTTLSSGKLKYPNGIPNRNGTYTFYIKAMDTCAFNSNTQEFVSYIGSYSPRPGDVYSCYYEYWQRGYWTYNKSTRRNDLWVVCNNNNRGCINRKVSGYQNVVLGGYSIPGGCNAVVSYTGNTVTRDNYAYRYGNTLKDSKDIGISSLTNISILDVLGEGPIEGIVDYEISPNAGYALGDIGYKNGVTIKRYSPNEYDKYGILRSIYWNEIPIADSSYDKPGSLNFEFIRLYYDNGSSAPKHTNIQSLENINLEEEFYTRRLLNGTYVNFLEAVATDGTYIGNSIKLPKKLTNTKVVGTKLFGKRVFQDGTSKTYKKSLVILNKDISGLRLHIKGLSLFKTIVDLTIWDSADQAAANSVAGRIDRQEMSFNLYLKRIDVGPDGKTVTLIGNPKYTGATTGTYSISLRDYYDQYFVKEYDVLNLYYPPNDPGGPGNGPDGYQRVPNYDQFIAGYTTYSHRHDGKVYNSYAKDVNKSNSDLNARYYDHVNQRLRYFAGEARDYSTLTMVGKLNQGPYIETFEWTGLKESAKTGFNQATTIGWEIEIEPTYIESVDPNVVIKSAIDSITEMYDDFISMPNTAGVLTTFDARYFTSIPQRAYDVRMLKVKVPSNYNPFAKTYDGIWDGTFKLSWTDNPAWCFYDLITNRRYGLGKYVDPDLTDKWTLYEIGQYCDQLVSAGQAGLYEPRFTCNVLISTREDAYKVINDMASIFRAIVFYNGGLIFTSQDRPKDAIYIFNNSNVKDGEFTYSNTSKRVRRNVALVRYNDKNNFYKPAVKYVEDRNGIIRFGIRETEVSAFGCTSEGQAERLGKWTLLSENLESELINFETSLPAMYLKPGDIVFIQDQNRQNKILGGRTYELTKDHAILDVSYDNISGYLNSINACNFNVLTPAGNVEIGTEIGNFVIENADQLNTPVTIDNELVSGINSKTIRRKQIQTVQYESAFTKTNTGDTSIFQNFVSVVDSGNFAGYTKLSFGGQLLDDKTHTLMQNTVWTIEINPDNYDEQYSPSISGFNSNGAYPGSGLEPHIDKTQKFRILDIEEQEEFRYKITALQYDESKFKLGDDI